MRIITTALLATSLYIAVIAVAADTQKPLATSMPFKLAAKDAIGPVFSSRAAVKLNDPSDGPVTDVALLRSRDGRFEAGLYEAGPSDQPIESYPDDEFIYVLEGGITLTSTDGTIVEAKAGESLSIPKGWKGRWTTQGYKKYYVTYTRK
jgi:uncharacterized cupin superfamily protein